MTPRFGDQVHVDLVAIPDGFDRTAAMSKYQVAQLLEGKTADEVVKFMNRAWILVLGAPRVVVADLGPEFSSGAFQTAMDYPGLCFVLCFCAFPFLGWRTCPSRGSGWNFTSACTPCQDMLRNISLKMRLFHVLKNVFLVGGQKDLKHAFVQQRWKFSKSIKPRKWSNKATQASNQT